MDELRRLLPRIELSPEAFADRHRLLRAVLLAHLCLVLAVVLAHPNQAEMMTWAFIGAAALCAALSAVPSSPRGHAVVVSLGLLACADALVHVSGGLTDMHFDYFVVLALVSLYQDWVPFALAVLTVGLHHVVFGLLDPAMVFSTPAAQNHPLRYALLHTVFVLAMSAAQLVYWRFTGKAAEELKAATAESSRLALVARHTDNAVVICDATGVIEWVNDAFTRLTGYSAEEAVGRNRAALMHGTPDELAAQLALFADLSHGIDVEFLAQARDGHRWWMNVEVRPIYENGEVVRLVGVERDVTARRSSEEQERAASRRAAELASALQEEKSILAGVISAIPHLVWWKDGHGRYVGANQAFLSVRGCTETALLGRTDAEVGERGALVEALAAIEADVATGGTPVVDRQVSVPGTAGAGSSFLVSVLPQARAADEAAGWIGVGADVSLLSELERQLAQAHRLETVGQLAAGIAHEINTPVQFVSDNTRFVLESFDSLLPAFPALAGLAGTPGTAGPLLTGVDLEFIAREVPAALAESMEGLERVAGIVRAMKDFSHPGQERVEADLNIVVNAAHAITEDRERSGRAEPGRISVTTRRCGPVVEIAVTDNGSGMDMATQARIFDPFFTTKQVGRGTGQGLSLAHSTVVQKHSGTITVGSAPGRGTTFTITLPAAEQAA